MLVTEPLGSTMDVYLETKSGRRIVCRVAAVHLEEGQSVAAHVAPQAIHLFEPNQPGAAGSPTRYGRSLRAQGELV